jgi:hypothetical protein
MLWLKEVEVNTVEVVDETLDHWRKPRENQQHPVFTPTEGGMVAEAGVVAEGEW